jgi:hypothetical protein
MMKGLQESKTKNQLGVAEDDQRKERFKMSNNFEEAMKARMYKGFENWNKGYEAWLKWCDELYEPDAHYNVYGKRLTLQQYKDLMKQFFSVFDMDLGEFYNMIPQGDWIAIRYIVYVTNKKTGEKTDLQSMEFVHCKDNPEPIGCRIIEGWALSDKPLSAE